MTFQVLFILPGHAVHLSFGAARGKEGIDILSFCFHPSYPLFRAYMFSGAAPYKGMKFARLNDLWEYNFHLERWRLVGGSPQANVQGEYGVQGVPNPNNWPGGRSLSAAFHREGEGTFIFGGYGYASNKEPAKQGCLNDLWFWDDQLRQWTWVGGVEHINAGSSMVSSAGQLPGAATNLAWPGARFAHASWKSGDEVYIFGGAGYHIDRDKYGQQNDLWRLDLKLIRWTWLGGQSVDKSGKYNGRNAWPGSRDRAACWLNRDGDIIMFGGNGFGILPGKDGSLNDMWLYTRDTGKFAYIGGSAEVDQLAVFGPLGVTSERALPGGRELASIWQLPNGDVWMFGGSGYASAKKEQALNDIWRWRETGWAWFGGNQHGDKLSQYDRRVATGIVLGGRDGCASWLAKGGVLLFGGEGYTDTKRLGGGKSRLADLWFIELNDPSRQTPVLHSKPANNVGGVQLEAPRKRHVVDFCNENEEAPCRAWANHFCGMHTLSRELDRSGRNANTERDTRAAQECVQLAVSFCKRPESPRARDCPAIARSNCFRAAYPAVTLSFKFS